VGLSLDPALDGTMHIVDVVSGGAGARPDAVSLSLLFAVSLVLFADASLSPRRGCLLPTPQRGRTAASRRSVRAPLARRAHPFSFHFYRVSLSSAER